jgi:two-component system CheB/CheR fusion protein
LQASNEELKSANEELQSMNEELQSTNEELETSKEELQSLNEELVTVNAEVQAKNDQLGEIQNDLKNLLDNTDGGTIFLDADLAIKRFTRRAAAVYRLVATDVGRPLGDIKSNIEGDDLVAAAQAVLDSLVPGEKQVRTTGGEQYRVRILPYRTLDNVIEGVVLTFADITELKTVEADARAARDYAESIVDTVREPLVVLDGDLAVISASRPFYRMVGVAAKQAVGRHLYELDAGQWDIPRLRELLETVLPRDANFENFAMEAEFPGAGRRSWLLNARRIPGEAGRPPLILLAIEAAAGGETKGKT